MFKERSALDHYLIWCVHGKDLNHKSQWAICVLCGDCFYVDYWLFAKRGVSSGVSRLPHSSDQKTRLGLLFLLGKRWLNDYLWKGLVLFYGLAKVSTMVPFMASNTQRNASA